MSAGLPKYVVVNLDDLDKAFEAGAEVTLEAIESKGLLNISGRDTKLGLKVRAPADFAAPLQHFQRVPCLSGRRPSYGEGARLMRATYRKLGPLPHLPYLRAARAAEQTASAPQVLGSGSLSKALKIKADAFSATATEKIGAAGGSAEAAAAQAKWTRRAHEKRVKEMVAAGLDPKKEAAKKVAARAAAKKQ